MKNYLSLNFLILLAVLVSCDNIELSDPVVRDHFYKLYGTYNNDFMSSIIETNDGGLLWVGYTSESIENDQADADFNAYPYICKVQPDGMVEWDTSGLLHYDACIAHDVKLVNQDSEIFVSISQKLSDDEFSVHLMPLALTGEYDTTYSISLDANRIISANIVERDDDSVRVIVQAEHISGASTTTSLHMLKLNAQNELEETFEYVLSDQLPSQVEAIYLSDDQIIIASTSFNQNIDDDTDVRVLNVIDQTILWEKLYGDLGVSETCSEVKIIDGKIVIAGNTTTGSDVQIHVLTIDPTSQVGEFKLYPSSNLENPVCNSFDLNIDNNYVFTGSIETAVESSDVFFLESDIEGDELLSKTFGTGGEQDGENIGERIIAIDGSLDYFLAGRLEPINNTDVLIFKLDENASFLD